MPRDPVPLANTSTSLTNFKALLSTPAALMALAFTAMICLANEVINLTFGVWMEASFGLQLAALGAAAAILGGAELLGEGLVALVTDRLGKSRAIFLGVLVNCFAVAALPLTARNLPLALTALFFFYISFEFTIVSSIPLMTEVMPAARATMMAGFFTSAAFGRVAASWITPGLYDLGYWFNILAVIAANVLSLAFLARLRRLSSED